MHEAKLRIALVYLKLGDAEQGLRVARNAVDSAPRFTCKSLGGSDMSVLTVLADAVMAKSGIDAAKGVFENAMALLATNGYAAGRLAEWHLLNDDIAGATNFESSIDIQSHSRFDGLMAALRLSRTSNSMGIGKVHITGRASDMR